MKFTVEIDRPYGAQDAGYTFAREARGERDDAVIAEVTASRGVRFAEDLADKLFDLDGPLYLGEDGNHYAVEFVWIGDEKKPAVWHRLQKEGKE